MEKPQLEATGRELSIDRDRQHGFGRQESGDVVAHQHWQPGYVKQFPAVGAAALLVIILTAIGNVLVLCLSNNKSTSQWSPTFPPNVAVSVLNAVGNVCLMVALSKGTSIAWWIKAIEGATISQLHRSWISSSSFYGIVTNLFRLDIIGFAALIAKLSVVDSVLYQRATTTYIGQDAPKMVSMLGAAATEFPSTGYVVAEGFAGQTQCDCFMIGDEYTSVVNTWQTSNGFFQGYNRYFQECNGVCYTYIDAIGFEIDCDKNINQSDIAIAPIKAFQAAGSTGGNSTAWTDIPIFNSSFFMSYANGDESNQTTLVGTPTINLNLQYFESYDPFNPSGETCQGIITTVQCKLRPALVRYPITITNFTNQHVTNGVSLGTLADKASNTDVVSNQIIQPYSYTLKQAQGFEVLSYLHPEETRELNSISYLGGLANALHIALTSTATITYQGQGAWALSQTGVLAQTMMFGPPNMGTCDCSFRNQSLDTIVAGINQLAYLTSTGMIDQKLITFPTNSEASSGFLFPTPAPRLTVNTSTPLTIQGVASNSTTYFRSLDGTLQISDVTFYRTHLLFVGLGVGLTLLCVAAVTSLFWRYGTLGREVSMGPIEIAGAFGAPVLSTAPGVSSSPVDEPTIPVKPENPAPRSGSRSHRPAPISVNTTVPHSPESPPLQTPASPVTFGNLDDLLASVGDRRVMYGFVDVQDDNQAASHEDGNTPSGLVSPTSPGISSSASRKRKSQVLIFGDATDGNMKSALEKSSARASVQPALSR